MASTVVTATATAAAVGTGFDRGLRSLQTTKGRAARIRRSVKPQTNDRQLIAYGAAHWETWIERSWQDVGYGPSHWMDWIEDDGAQPVDPPSDASAAPQEEIAETGDVPACVLGLFPKGSNSAVYGGVGVLPVDIIQGFRAIVATLKNKVDLADASAIEIKLDPIVDAYRCVVADIKEADGSGDQSFPNKTLRNVDVAKYYYNKFYDWAKPIVTAKINISAAMGSQAKLQVVPYIAALAYAIRIRVITLLVEVEMASQRCDKEKYLSLASRIVDDFVAMVQSALDGLTANTNPLEIALDYELPMAMYMTLMTNFRASMGLSTSPSAWPEQVTVWVDARLVSIREALHWDPSDDAGNQDQGRSIELNNVKESLWWANFIDTDLASLNPLDLRKSIDIREVARVLGVDSDEIAAKLALKPGQKNTLLQLPSASALRAALCANIDQICQAIHLDRPSSALPPSFVRLQAAAPRTFTGHMHWVMSVAVCADGERVVSSSRDKTARVWSLSTGQPLRTFAGHTDDVNCVALSSDGATAVSGSDDRSVRVWNVDSGDAPYTLLQDYSGRVWAVAVAPDGRSIASGSADRSVHLWNAETGDCIASLPGHSDTVACVAFSPDGKILVSGSWDKSIRVWDVRTRSLLHTLDGHSDAVRGVAVTPDGRRLISGSAGGTVKVWNLSSGEEEMSFEGHTQAVSSVAVFPDGQRIVSGSFDKSVRVWNLRRPTPEPELELTGHSDAVQCVAVSPDGRRVVSGSWDSTVKVWDLSEDSGEDAAR